MWRSILGAGLASLLAACGNATSTALPTGTLGPVRPSVAETSGAAAEGALTAASSAGPGSTAPGSADQAAGSAPLPSAPPAAAPAAALARPGNAGGNAAVGGDAAPADTSAPTTVVGNGSPAGCTSDAVVAAVARGGVITFSCGPAPLTITMSATAKVVNAAADDVVIDGGGLVTLSGGGSRRILYLNTCDEAQGFTTSHCDDQATPRLTVQNIALADGNAAGAAPEGSGGAIFARGGRLKVVNTTFTGNRCDATGPDVGGAGIRVFDQYQDLPVYVVGSTFTGGRCSNGAGISSIGVSWVVLNSVFTDNQAIGDGANPAQPGTPGGGSGGAVYADGNRFTIRLAGTRIEGNRANEGGGAVFFVSNDRTGTMSIEDSTLRDNPSAGFETDGLPGIFFLGAAPPTVSASTMG